MRKWPPSKGEINTSSEGLCTDNFPTGFHLIGEVVMSLRFRLVFALSCAALAALLCVSYATTVRAEAEQLRADAIARYGGEVVGVVAAVHSLEPGDVIGAADVSLRDWVTDLVPEGAMTSLDGVLGKEVAVPVARNSPVTELTFRDETHMAEVPRGHVAISVPITDKLGVPRSIRQGSSLVAYGVGREASELLSADIEVLSAPAAGSSASGLQLSLAVPADRVEKVLSASASGDLRLVVPARGVELAPEGEPAAPEAVTDGGLPQPATQGEEG